MTAASSTTLRSRSNLLILSLGLLILLNIIWQFTFDLPSDKELSSIKPQLDSEPSDQSSHHAVAGLDCKPHGGPDNPQDAAEMVYWKDIPSDAGYMSPMRRAPGPSTKYLTFEPDEGGWNNIRMALETAVTLAMATGRTLVMPPSTQMYLLWHSKDKKEKKKHMKFDDFFHFDAVAAEHAGMEVISFETFLEREALTGNLIDKTTGKPSFPPDNNRTDWNGQLNNWESARKGQGKSLWTWLRDVTAVLDWDFNKCVAGIPSEPGPEGVARMKSYLNESVTEVIFYPQAKGRRRWKTRVMNLTGHPTPVDAPPAARLSEIMTERREMCIYDEELQQARVIHIVGEQGSGYRMLIHFYAFIFFEDWRQDLWTKRFVRDHIRYVDEIQCAAARVVKELRKLSIENGDPTGGFDTFHIRRGDFQYKMMHLSAEEIYENNTKDILQDGRTVFIATDEKKKSFFDPLKKHYNVRFLKDFEKLTKDVNPNYYGMLDQAIASRGDSFIGVYCSTFTGYINRMRGYHTQYKEPRNLNGTISSYYYVPKEMSGLRTIMHDSYKPLDPPYWAMEFPVAWRDIDHGVDDDLEAEDGEEGDGRETT